MASAESFGLVGFKCNKHHNLIYLNVLGMVKFSSYLMCSHFKPSLYFRMMSACPTTPFTTLYWLYKNRCYGLIIISTIILLGFTK